MSFHRDANGMECSTLCVNMPLRYRNLFSCVLGKRQRQLLSFIKFIHLHHQLLAFLHNESTFLWPDAQTSVVNVRERSEHTYIHTHTHTHTHTDRGTDVLMSGALPESVTAAYLSFRPPATNRQIIWRWREHRSRSVHVWFLDRLKWINSIKCFVNAQQLSKCLDKSGQVWEFGVICGLRVSRE